MKTEIHLSLDDLKSEEEFHYRVSQRLGFPYYYGRNQDAFWDCLTDIFEETSLRVAGYATLNETLKGEINGYLEMLREYEQKIGGVFAVVID